MYFSGLKHKSTNSPLVWIVGRLRWVFRLIKCLLLVVLDTTVCERSQTSSVCVRSSAGVNVRSRSIDDGIHFKAGLLSNMAFGLSAQALGAVC